MPELSVRPSLTAVNREFPDWGTEPIHHSLNQYVPYMCWPNDEKARADFNRLWHLEMRKQAEAMPALKSDPHFSRLIELHFQGIGAWSGIGEMISSRALIEDANNRTVRGEWVGGLLCFAYLLHTQYADRVKGRISLRKVRSLVFLRGNQLFAQAPGRQALNDAWEEFKSVAHLWAGMFMLEHFFDRTQIKHAASKEIPTNLDSEQMQVWVHGYVKHYTEDAFISFAKSIQAFGLSYKPQHSRTPILNHELLWAMMDVPDRRIDPPTVSFPDDLFEMYEDYKHD